LTPEQGKKILDKNKEIEKACGYRKEPFFQVIREGEQARAFREIVEFVEKEVKE